jgi:hypothetical protein
MEFSSLVNLRLVDFFFNSFYFFRNSQKGAPTILKKCLDKYLVVLLRRRPAERE